MSSGEAFEDWISWWQCILVCHPHTCKLISAVRPQQWLGGAFGGKRVQQHQVMNYYLRCLPSTSTFEGFPPPSPQPPVPQPIWCFLKTPKLLSHENNFFNICRREKRNILKERRGFAQKVTERKQLFSVLPHFALPPEAKYYSEKHERVKQAASRQAFILHHLCCFTLKVVE